MKHNKKRNTAFLYEVLVKEATEKLYLHNDIDSYNQIIGLLRELTSSKHMASELKLYLALQENVKNKDVARSIVEDALAERKKINSKELFNEQTHFISKINKTVGPQVFNKFVKDYRVIGNLYHLFNNYDSMKLNERSMVKESIVDFMCLKEAKVQEMREPIDSITYNILVKKFNEKYNNALSDSQKQLVINYITSSSDNEFKLYLGEEVERLTGVLQEAIKTQKEIIEDPEMIQKGEKILGLLSEFKTKKHDDKMVEDLMRVQMLVEEIQKKDDQDDD